MTVKIIHQDDRKMGGRERWLLDGIGYHDGKGLRVIGFTWIPGPDGGCWQAPNREAIEVLINMGMEVKE